jgi:hypothetical protein
MICEIGDWRLEIGDLRLETGDQNSSADLSAASAPLSFDLSFATSIGFSVAQRTDSAAP